MTLAGWLAALSVGLLAGAISGLVGIGGGAVMVPFLYFFLAQPEWSGARIPGTEQAVIALAVAYLVALAWAMTNLSYDIWGAFVVAPVLLIVGVPLLRRMFRGSQANLFGVMVAGIAAPKLCPACCLVTIAGSARNISSRSRFSRMAMNSISGVISPRRA